MKKRKTFDEIVVGIKELKKQGYVPSLRKGDTGIGKTLEQKLGIPDNSFPGPDGIDTELKSARKGSGSMLTLFTKSPLPRGINTKLRYEYGYPDDNFPDKKVLRTTIDATGFNKIKKSPEKIGFKIAIVDDRIEIQATRPPKCFPDTEMPYWTKKSLEQRIKEKYAKSLLYVKADVRMNGEKEEFHYTEAWHLKGFDSNTLFKLLNNGILDVDIRLGLYEDGRNHDHGTGIRVRPHLIDQCFSYRKQVI